MKLLFDENLSPGLVRSLMDDFPDSIHVSDVGLASSSDEALWRHARDNDFTLVSKDTDFNQMSFLRGFPQRSYGFARATAQCATSRHCSWTRRT